MNILWITNIVFPEALYLLKGKEVPKVSGGWMLGAAYALLEMSGIKLTIAAISQDVNTITKLEGERITYWLLPYGKGNTKINHEYEPLWRQIRDTVKPDVVHLHGTEFSHGLAYIEACGANKVCVSIQGLTSAIASYYCYGLSRKEIISAWTLKSVLHGGIINGYRDYLKRGTYEKELLMRVQHIIGRTTWDHDKAWTINPVAQYHYCGEVLRSDFYTGPIWKYSECRPHSIFISQGGKPIKGLHQVLKAMPLVLRHYPDATIRVAGANNMKALSFKQRLKLTDYGNYLRKYINANRLQNIVMFTGPLDGEKMRQEYLRCNVFICPSSIENSPNSLGEAQILGVPVIASYAGGIPDMMKGDENHLYRYEETDMLASKICQLFALEGRQEQVLKMRQEALNRHDPVTNANTLFQIYKSIIEDANQKTRE